MTTPHIATTPEAILELFGRLAEERGMVFDIEIPVSLILCDGQAWTGYVVEMGSPNQFGFLEAAGEREFILDYHDVAVAVVVP
jgi:hypothetical protein